MFPTCFLALSGSVLSANWCFVYHLVVTVQMIEMLLWTLSPFHTKANARWKRHHSIFLHSPIVAWGQFLKRLVSARKLKLSCEGWICECSQVKICEGSRTLASFHSQVQAVLAKGTTRKLMFKKLAQGFKNCWPRQQTQRNKSTHQRTTSWCEKAFVLYASSVDTCFLASQPNFWSFSW